MKIHEINDLFMSYLIGKVLKTIPLRREIRLVSSLHLRNEGYV